MEMGAGGANQSGSRDGGLIVLLPPAGRNDYVR